MNEPEQDPLSLSVDGFPIPIKLGEYPNIILSGPKDNIIVKQQDITIFQESTRDILIRGIFLDEAVEKARQFNDLLITSVKDGSLTEEEADYLRLGAIKTFSLALGVGIKKITNPDLSDL